MLEFLKKVAVICAFKTFCRNFGAKSVLITTILYKVARVSEFFNKKNKFFNKKISF